MRNFPIIACLSFAICYSHSADAADWISDPSYFTHSPQTGTRVTQYAPVGPFFLQPRPDYVESGFHHERSSIRVGDSSDNYVRTTRWGEPVRPYGEWQFPYRPYSVPYDMWGPQFPPSGFAPYYGVGPGAGMGAGFGFPGRGRMPYAQPFTHDTWYDRQTRPQGRVPRRDPRDVQFFHRRDETLRDPLAGEMEGPSAGSMDGAGMME